METINFQGRKIAYSQIGEGPAVVFLHGFMESSLIWEDFRHVLSKSFTVICIDLPGHGSSDSIAEIHPMLLMANAVKSVLDELRIIQCVMIGHSMGGYVALAFARDYYKMLKGVCLFHSNALADSDEAKNNRLRAVEFINQDKTEYISSFIPSLFAHENVEVFGDIISFMRAQTLKMQPQGIIAAQLGMRERLDSCDVLKIASFPVLSILGKQDSRMPYQKMLDHLSYPAHSELLILDKCGHMGFIEQKDITLKKIVSFVSNCFNQ